jgi:hypothetical protein
MLIQPSISQEFPIGSVPLLDMSSPQDVAVAICHLQQGGWLTRTSHTLAMNVGTERRCEEIERPLPIKERHTTLDSVVPY